MDRADCRTSGAKLLVTDDAGSLKTVAEEVDLDQQICKSHVKRNTEALIADLRAILGAARTPL